MNEWVLLGIGIFLTVGTGIFVASEFSLVALDRQDLERRRTGGEVGLDRVIRGLSRTSTHLSSAQLGITLTTLLAGYTLEPAISGFLDAPLGEQLRDARLAAADAAGEADGRPVHRSCAR